MDFQKLCLIGLAFIFTSEMSFGYCSSCYNTNCNCTNRNSHYHNSNYRNCSSSSCSTYLVETREEITEDKFPNCKNHYMVTKTTTKYYSDGSKLSFAISTIYNSDGSILVDDCRNVKHIIYNNEHYFTFLKDKYYRVMNSQGIRLTGANYTQMQEVAPNRLLVKRDKKYGVIDLNQKTIIPIKYQELEQIENNNVFISKLNHYYGIVDIDNNILVENTCDKIKPLQDTLLLKQGNKYGLADLLGNVLLTNDNDQIKKLGEYILVKKNNKYAVYDFEGNQLSDYKYSRVKLERNQLKGFTVSDTWESL